ncbi:HD domain-containing protein [Flavilitoribacter nigricans]|uniref:Metal-dependent HD superfamily phosphohydrolase n=1 Tax=Flavilitoribacter nigricans (strain ATCC 23147 / DSM 23189 / NBRC 102662 / NCIMB 1420 / SS-2) TaxID=1122177 RepID=A0A2D0MYT6_FLAN2|nr:hypothetical protein [Flavilitoribacter nigricans]PHN01434.1 hypothetical protein CRP01_37240 [Flavilitoribacter nigricans DSM 23189 = NBRC 102662]
MDFVMAQWKELSATYCSKAGTVRKCWSEIEKAYTSRRRHYHDLQHLHELLQQAAQQRSVLKDYDVLRFSIFYHDFIYSSLRKDNEIKSAQVAEKKLDKLGFPSLRAARCLRQIKATQGHQLSVSDRDPDLPYFLDFDLAILGADWDRYLLYTQKIRREYQIYPNWMYRKGRRKVLSHFLERPRLYFTPLYFEQYEFKARDNLKRELAQL